MRPDPRTWLFDMVQAAHRVQRFMHGRTYENYLADELLRAGVERQFEIIGEALSQLRRQHPGIAEHVRAGTEADHIRWTKRVLTASSLEAVLE